MPGLDGLRAIAVVAVVVFHLDSSWLPGGFLGVDLFFVISGFLITSLLLAEVRETGGTDLPAFYLRRLRRLLPSVLLLVGVVVLAVLLIWTRERATLRGSVLSSVLYVNNWWSILDHQSYFVSAGRPPMLQHLWSLAIEEQYYLLWPLVVMAVVTGARVGPVSGPARLTMRMRRLSWIAALLALTSTGLMAIIAVRTAVPYGTDSSRVYFGTDTHSMGLLVGSAAAAAVAVRSGRPTTRSSRFDRAADLVAAGSLLVLIYRFTSASEFDQNLYRGGFLTFAVFAVVVVWVITRSQSRLGRLLDQRPLRWIGQRSYAIYLWHWPVVVVTRPGIDLHGPTLLIDALRVGVILALADASHRFVEQRFRTPSSAVVFPAGRRAGVGFGIAGVVCLAGLAILAANTPTAPARPSTAPRDMVIAPPSAAPSPAVPTPVAPARAGAARSSTAGRTVAPRRPVVANPAVTGFGDSVLLGAGAALRAMDHNVGLDAVEGRQPNQILDDVLAAAARHQLAPIVLLHIGNNGIIDPSQLDRTLRALRDRTRVVVVTLRVPRDWQDPNNSTLRKVSSRYANVRLVDWQKASQSHGGYFYDDAYHLNPTGAVAYAQLVMAAVRS